MKKLLYSALFVTFCLTLTNCNNNNNNSNPGGVWQATINGTQQSGDYYTAFYNSDTKDIILMIAKSTSEPIPYIQLAVGYDETGLTVGKTYSLGDSGTDHGAYVAGTNMFYTKNAGDGTLTITKFDLSNRTISATFSFTGTEGAFGNGTDIATITNGKFNDVKFTIQ